MAVFYFLIVVVVTYSLHKYIGFKKESWFIRRKDDKYDKGICLSSLSIFR